MSELPSFTKIVAGLSDSIPFVGPEAIERRMGKAFELRLGANESAFGVSPHAVTAMQTAIRQLHWYNDPENHDLRTSLAAHHHISAREVTIGAGIDDLLGLAVRAYVEPGQAVVASLGAYPTFVYHAEGFGCRLISPLYLHDGGNDLMALADATRAADVRLLYLANPDNPSGTWYSADEIDRLLQILPDRCVFILDEAYVEFVPPEAVPKIDTSDPRLIRMRTFSKAHGLAGARIGYAIANPHSISAFERIRLHFGVNRVAQAGALAALGDSEFVAQVVGQVEEGRREYHQMGVEQGLPTLPSATNFVTFDAGIKDNADRLLKGLTSRSVFIRKPSKPPLDRCIRVTVGTPDERALFAERLVDAWREVKG